MAQEAEALDPARIIGERVLVERRRKRGPGGRAWTQEDLAKEATTHGVKVGPVTVSRIEHGRLPSWNELLALSLALDSDPISLGAREEDYPELRLTRKFIEQFQRYEVPSPLSH